MFGGGIDVVTVFEVKQEIPRKVKSVRRAPLLLLIGLVSDCYGQQQPNVAAQREAMKKLDFLVGKWSGGASVSRGPGEPMRLRQTKEVQYKLDGLMMLIEGTGRNAEHWPETTETTFGSSAPRKSVEMNLHRQQ
jgi:hypothetical protein